MFNTLSDIKSKGFTGFRSINELFVDNSFIPKIQGIYLVVNLENINPDFLAIGTGGYFKGKNPNVSIQELESNWVSNSIVLYIGKAGGHSSNATLHSRLKQYLGFGLGKAIGHWGGRFIWQLQNSRNLVVCWKTLPNDEPREVELKLIKEFKMHYGKRPFANLKD